MRIFSKIIFALSVCVVSFSACADGIVVYDIFAKKNEKASENKIFYWDNGEYTCDAPTALFFEKKEAKKLCGLCPNRKLVKKKGGYQYLNGRPYSPRREFYTPDEKIENIYACVPESIKTCPKDKPLLDKFGFCHSCDDDVAVDISWNLKKGVRNDENKGKKALNEACSVCKNRKVQGENCILNECPTDKQLRDGKGSCLSCDKPEAVFINFERGVSMGGGNRIVSFGYNENRCSQDAIRKINPWGEDSFRKSTCSNRMMYADGGFGLSYYDILKECPLDMPLRDEVGGCHSCDEEKDISQRGYVTLWGVIRCGKVYDSDLKSIGSLKNASFSKSLSLLSDDDLYGEEYGVYDSKGKKVAYMKIGKRSGGSYTTRMEPQDAIFRSFIYDLEDRIVAEGTVTLYEDETKNKDFFDGVYYFVKSRTDKVCPNRIIIKDDDRFGPIISRLKKSSD